jgi:hypothetical protein
MDDSNVGKEEARCGNSSSYALATVVYLQGSRLLFERFGLKQNGGGSV